MMMMMMMMSVIGMEIRGVNNDVCKSITCVFLSRSQYKSMQIVSWPLVMMEANSFTIRFRCSLTLSTVTEKHLHIKEDNDSNMGSQNRIVTNTKTPANVCDWHACVSSASGSGVVLDNAPENLISVLTRAVSV